MRKYIVLTALLGVVFTGLAQVGIGTKKPSDAAILDLTADDKGLLVPRVNLVDPFSFAPMTGNMNAVENIGLLVYHKNDANLPNMEKGFYYWTAEKRWNKISDSQVMRGQADLQGNFFEGEHGIGFGHADITTPSGFEPGEVIYRMELEEKTYYINFTREIGNIIKNDTDIIDLLHSTVVDHMKEAGNIYYGDHDGEKDTPDVLYLRKYDKASQSYTTKAVDLLAEFLKVIESDNFVEKVVDRIRDKLAYDITKDSVVNTGKKKEGKDVKAFLTSVNMKESDAETRLILPWGATESIDEVFSIQLYDQKGNYLNVGITDIEVRDNKKVVDFALGSGSLYTTLPEGSYAAVVEFVSEK